MFNYNGGCLTQKELIQFEEGLTFSDAQGYSREDNEEIIKHLARCSGCRERRQYAIAAWFENHELAQLAR